MTDNRGLSPDLRAQLLTAVGVTERSLAQQLSEHPDQPITPMTLAELTTEEQAR